MTTVEELIWALKQLPPETVLNIKKPEAWLRNVINFEKSKEVMK